MKQIKKYFPILYIAFLFFGALYVRNVMSQEELDVRQVTEEKEVRDVKPVDVTLRVVSNTGTATYEERMQNTNTFDDFLEKLRDNRNFFFEKTEYIYGTEYELVNNIKAPKDFRWAVYENDEEITFLTSGHELKDDAVYTLRLEEK